MAHVVTPNELTAAASQLSGLVADLDPEWVTPREAPVLWERLEDIRRLACGAQVVLSKRVDESDVAERAGLRNGAEWIAQRSGGSLRSAYEAVSTSKRLADLPLVMAAMQNGSISPAQAVVVADAASCDPTAAESLVDLAQKASLSELRREALRVKQAADPDPDETERRIRRERRLRWFVDNEGAFCMSGRGPLVNGSEFATVLGPIIDEIFAAAREAGIAEPRDAYTWDALVEMARMAWAHMHAADASGHADADDVVGSPTRTSPDVDGNDRPVEQPNVGDPNDARASDDGAQSQHRGARADDSDDVDVLPDADVDCGAARAGDGSSARSRDEAAAARVVDGGGDLADDKVDRGAARADDDGGDGCPERDDKVDRDGVRADNSSCGRPQNDGEADGVGGSGGGDSGARHDEAGAGMAGRLVDVGAVPVRAPKRRKRKAGVNPWVRMVLRVDHSALVRGAVDGEETCEIAGVGPVPVRVARELLGDAVLHLVITKGQDASVTYLGRGLNAAQRIAAVWAQPECQRLGCHRPVREWDHRVPYAAKPETRIANIQGFCEPDHDLKTRYGWELVEGVGKREMVPPTDPRHPANAPPAERAA